MTKPTLFEPIQLGTLNLRNRIVMAPMTRSFSPNGVPNEGNIAYYERRAKHDVGLIVTEGTLVGHPGASGYPDVPQFHGEEALAGWKGVVDAVHAQGGAIVPQLWHVGAIRKAKYMPNPDVPAYSPSGFMTPKRENGVAMTQQDVNDVIDAFTDSAEAAQKLGFDGVEVHGAHGYLIDQFFWEGTNKRTDTYGGDMIDRTRFAAELISSIRQRVGSELPIILRWSQWKMQNYNAKLAPSPGALEFFLAPLVDAGVDIFHCSTRRFWEPEFEGSALNLAGWAKKVTGKPTITVGSIGLDTGFVDEEKRGMVDAAESNAASSLADLHERVGNGEFDLVAVGRALLQDPEWVIKVRNGRFDELEDYSKDVLKTLH
ncbi:MAG: NADH:flavin oxidoreductase [Chloroflexota bacterium]